MGDFTFIDHLFNVCRSVSDVLHILLYVLLVIAAILYAAYKYDEKSFFNKTYHPIIRFLIRRGIITFHIVNTGKRRRTPFTYQVCWSVGSNRLPYIVKIIRNYLKKF